MDHPTLSTQLILYCVLIFVASLAGGWIPLFVRLTHTRMQVATSFVASFMLGIGLLHLLPHAWHQLRSIDRAALWLVGGFVVMFFIQRFFHFHHHDVPDEAPEGSGNGHGHGHHHHHHAHAGAPDDGHNHGPGELTLAHRSAKNLSWGGAAFGLTLHTLIDGFTVAASVHAEAHDPGHGFWLGLGTFLVVVLHKPFDAMAIGTLMAVHGTSRISRHVANGILALAIPVGAALFYLGTSQFGGNAEIFVGSALAFAAGSFLCIAASDLLPELQFHSHDRIKLSVALLLGLGLAWLIGIFETSGHG